LFALDHNFLTQNPSRSSKVSKDSDFSLVSKKALANYYHLAVWAKGPDEVGQSGLKVVTYDITHKKSEAQSQKKFFSLQTARLAASSDHLDSAYDGTEVMLVKVHVQIGCFCTNYLN